MLECPDFTKRARYVYHRIFLLGNMQDLKKSSCLLSHTCYNLRRILGKCLKKLLTYYRQDTARPGQRISYKSCKCSHGLKHIKIKHDVYGNSKNQKFKFLPPAIRDVFNKGKTFAYIGNINFSSLDLQVLTSKSEKD